ncbi:hypothetical protein RND71_008302 [Anisodus tanguticus]|uniref:Uncharacterized protein n=1 Tax=Anisodus tanguticus TaxID=243964 RepID=A0AAE1SNV5_9SOLA|nr:hypothetical protein RND71_008302 [Anisodus tanguticus]
MNETPPNLAKWRGPCNYMEQVINGCAAKYTDVEFVKIDVDELRDKKSNKDEDSILKKQIILGEKCKVPADEDDDTILYDEDGNRISAYHPKPPIGLIISRQSSNIEEDAIPK